MRREKTDHYNDLHASVIKGVKYINWGIMDYIGGWALLILCHTALQVEWQVVAFHEKPLPKLLLKRSAFRLDPREVQLLYADTSRYLKGTGIHVQSILQSFLERLGVRMVYLLSLSLFTCVSESNVKSFSRVSFLILDSMSLALWRKAHLIHQCTLA